VIRKFLVVLLFAMPLVAQDAPRFFIERIEVRNAKRVSPDVVIFESRLREGHEYSETELADASARLGRLPFLLSADFSLEKGTDRGRHVLVITVTETRSFFYKIEGVTIFSDDSNAGLFDDNAISITENDAALGYRWFVGRRGVIHTGLQYQDDNRAYTYDYSALAVGYTHYDIFGTRAFATLNLKYPLGSGGGEGFGSISPQVVVGMPLSPNQTLTAGYDETTFEGETFRVNQVEVENEESQRIITLKWAYNTTNHPLLPTRGTLLSVTPNAVWRDDAGLDYTYGPGLTIIDVRKVIRHERTFGIDASAARYWELSERHSVSAALEGGWARAHDRRTGLLDRDYDYRYGILRGGYSFSFWDRARTARDGDSRLEVNAGLSTRSKEHVDPQYRRFVETETFQISADWVRRNAWGTLRLGVGYGW